MCRRAGGNEKSHIPVLPLSVRSDRVGAAERLFFDSGGALLCVRLW